MSARFRLRRIDGKLFLERWGFECPWFGVFLHHIEAPDPTPDLHDHPWPFGSFILKGGYTEQRCATKDAQHLAQTDHFDRPGLPPGARGYENKRKRWSWKTIDLATCHTITDVPESTWTLVFRGPKRKDRQWGFFTREGFVDKDEYDATRHRPLYEERV